MPNFVAVSRTHHTGQRWQRPSSYRFAAQDAVVPLVAQELPKAAMHIPFGFIATDERFVPVAVQGLEPGRNLFVAPDGRWLAGYIPAAYRAYPFLLARTEEGTQVLCIDQDSGLITDTGQGESFFNDDGSPAKAVADVLDFLNQVQAGREQTARVCALLQQHGLIQPWPLKVHDADDVRAVEGLFRIDEGTLNALPADALLALRDGGALALAYCQLLSMQHLTKLGPLAQAHAQAAAAQPLPQTPNGELDLEFLNKGGTISFGNLL